MSEQTYGAKVQSFEAALRAELEAGIEDVKSAGKRRPLSVGNTFIDIFVRVAKVFGIDNVLAIKREDLVAMVGNLYDQYVAKIDLPGPFDAFDAFVHSLVKSTVLSIINSIYDKFKTAHA